MRFIDNGQRRLRPTAWRLGLAAALVLALTLIAAGCGSGGGSASTGGSPAGEEPAKGSGAGSGELLNGEGKEIVFFTVEPSLSPTVAIFNKAAEEEAERLGYKFKAIISGVDISVQSQQIQQYLASGQQPAGFIIASLSPETIAAGTRALSKIAPVVLVQSEPTEEEFEWITAFAGDGPNIGTIMGELMLEAREAAEKEGRKLHSPEGNMLIVGPTPGLKEWDSRKEAFEEVFANEPFNVLQEVRIEDNSTQGTYETLTQIMPKIKNEGLDFVLSNDGDQTAGVLKALKQNGFEPGKDVTIVSGNCSESGDGVTAQENGEVFGQVLLSHTVNGSLFVRTLAQYIATEEVLPGEFSPPLSPGGPPPAKVEPPHQKMLVPVVGVKGKTAVKKAKIWGESVDEICVRS